MAEDLLPLVAAPNTQIISGTRIYAKSSIQVSGVNTVIKNLKMAKEANRKAFERGLLKAGKFLLRMSKKIVPVDTGALKKSGFVRLRWKGQTRVDVRVGYSIFYAIYQHEILWYRHRKGQQAKFLEEPSRVFAKDIRDIVRLEVQKAVAGKAKSK